MNASQKTKAAYFNYIGSIELPVDVIKSCYHSGDCTEDCRRCLQLPEIQAELADIDPLCLQQELSEYGAWSEDELKNHEDNLIRILWIASANITDENY